MLVITRNGKTVVLTGWRAWLAVALMCLVGAVVLVVIVFLALGITLTIAGLMLFIVPLTVLLALLAGAVRALQSR